MKMTRLKKTLLLTVCTVLIAAMAFCISGCDGNMENPEASSQQAVSSQEVTASENQSAASQGETVLGEGATQFIFTVIGLDGTETRFTVNTDKTKVGEALQELDLIQGEMGDYGLYVKTVNGITLNFATDGKYWAFYINGQYGMTGVDLTDIVAGETYTFKAE